MLRWGLARCVFCRGRCRKGIDHLAWAGVVQLFASLMFDGIGVALQPLDVTFQQFVLPLKAAQLALQHLRVLSLLLVDRKPVLPKNDVKAHCNGEDCCRCGRDLSPFCMDSLVQTHYGGTSPHCARCIRAGHTVLSTNFAANSVKWKTVTVYRRTKFIPEPMPAFGY